MDEDYQEELDKLKEEVETWKAKFKSMELKKRESDLALNKIKTEINSLRAVDKLWKDSAKTVYTKLNDVKLQFDVQVDQVLNGMSGLTKAGERITAKVPLNTKVKACIAGLQQKIIQQEETISNLNNKIRVLTAELADKTKKVERLSQGIEEEVDRLIKPLRDKLSDTMVLLMKEKSLRAQDRREMADLWPIDHMLPTVLMKYRALTPEERERRALVTRQQSASLALSLEIRANVLESRSWEIKYDDYGRPFYQHVKSGEVSWEPPEILQYKPPPGRDDMGCVTATEDNDMHNWIIRTDNRGQVYYERITANDKTGSRPISAAAPAASSPTGDAIEEVSLEDAPAEQLNPNYTVTATGQVITYIPPFAYRKVPLGKTRETVIGEAAALVLSYIKEKITKHIEKAKKLKQELENPLTHEDLKRKAKEERNKSAEQRALDEAAAYEEPELIDLAEYQYDIETVEMLANSLSEAANKANAEKDPDLVKGERRAFLEESAVRKFDPDLFLGITVPQIDVAEADIPKIRGIVEELAMMEEKLEKQVDRVRVNLKEFSFVLMDKIAAHQKELEKQLKKEAEMREKERRQALKQHIIDERNRISANRARKIEERRAQQAAAAAPPPAEITDAVNETETAEGKDQAEDGEKADMNDDGEEEGMDSTENILDAPAVEKVDSDDEAERVLNQAIADEEVREAAAAAEAASAAGLDENGNPSEGGHAGSAAVIAKKAAPKKMDYGSVLFGNPLLTAAEPDYSAEMITLATNLVNFAVFSGYSNCESSESPHDSNLEYSLQGDYQMVFEKSGENKDDEWLTCSFFINVSKSSMDKVKASFAQIYNGTYGLSAIGPVDTDTLVYDSYRPNETVTRHKDKPYTPGLNKLENHIRQQFNHWRACQLMSDVVRSQLQTEAIAEVQVHRLLAFQPSQAYGSSSSSGPADLTTSRVSKVERFREDRVKLVQLRIKQITFDKLVPFQVITENLYYISVTLGHWMTRTHTLAPSPFTFVWDDLSDSVSASVSINDIQVENLRLELLDENPASPELYFIGQCEVDINSVTGSNLSREMTFTAEMLERDSDNVVGTLNISIVADYEELHPQGPTTGKAVTDPENIEKTQEILKSFPTIPIRTESDKARVTPPPEALNAFVKLVDDLRGDGVNFIRQLTGDVTAQQLVKTGNALNENIVKKLPNFQRATAFLQRKANYYRWEVESLTAEINEYYSDLDQFLAKKYEYAFKQSIEGKNKHKKLIETSEDLKKEVIRIQKLVFDCRKPNPMPKEPVFEELPPVAYVPKVPPTGGLDSRGKKKKQIPAAELTVLMERATAGELDGFILWPFPDNNWPSQAQQLKLGKVIEARNAILDEVRRGEEEAREKIMAAYQEEMVKFEMLERRRKIELEKLKRDCRKINLRFQYHMERANRVQYEYKLLENNYNSVNDLMNLNVKSKDRFKTMRFKQMMEYDRQKEYLESNKKRLLKALKARRLALDLPSSATNELHYAQLVKQSEEALRIIRFEIFECKQLLINEGIRLRTLFQEEVTLCRSELARVKITREIVNQRDSCDKILERYKYEILNLMQDMEKLRIQESEKDEVGVDTVDDMGEKYVEGKVWTSPAIVRCQRQIDICMAKINLTEGLNKSTNDSQTVMVDVLSTKWGSDFLALRDSWVEHSDFERSQQLLSDSVQWVASENQKLKALRSSIEKEKVDLNLQLEAMKEQRELSIHTHELETTTINDSSTEVIQVMRNHLDDFREECKDKINSLEKSIIDLSRECQTIREELLAQEMLFDEKVKVMWAFIHTLQTAVQQLSARMEMILEEREQIVIQSKLVADKMRHQLRIERKHCSNLMFIIHSQRGFVRYLNDVIKKLTIESKKYQNQQKIEKSNLRREIWEQLFCFTRMCTDVDSLFEFFAARLANLAGSRSSINNALARNNAAMVLSALCKSPRPLIRKYAARALGGMGWDGFVETRILLWDCVMYWKIYRNETLAKESKEFASSFERFDETGKIESILNIAGEVEEFIPSGNMSLRTIIKQRRQWALRAARRNEGPNVANQRLLNIKDGVIPGLLEMTLKDGDVDWEIARNAALAISIASYEANNHYDMTHNELCVKMIISMCQRQDAEVQTHAAVTIANLCHKDEAAQLLFGQSGAIPSLIGMLESTIVDVLEAATSALANITCFCDVNCLEVLKHDGVKKMVGIITHSYSENLLDLDQNDEVQANAAEMLANVSRYSTDETVGYFTPQVIDAMVLMCASRNKQLRRHIPLVIGNIAQSETCRFEVGVKGGIEALFLVLEDNDTTIQANSLWSLCNLMWHPPNQERAGRFMADIIAFLHSDWEPVRNYASTLLANVLYYNTTNRVRFLEYEGAMELLLHFVKARKEVTVVEGSLRALLSLSYLDSVALWLGPEGQTIPMFIDFLLPPHYSRESMRYSLEILCNLCLHHANRRIIFDNKGIDAIVGLHIDQSPHIRELSVQIIEHLEDITPPEVLARVKADIGLERMVVMATSEDPLIRAVAAESIGEEIWHNDSKQDKAVAIGGVDVLLGILNNPEEPIESTLPALWSMRNILQNNYEAQSQFGYRDGFSVVASLIRRALQGVCREQSEKVFEGALYCMTAAVLKHDRNSRKLLIVGLDAVMDLADGTVGNSKKNIDPFVEVGLRSEGVKALAKQLLLMLSPYNYVVCKNCQRKQDMHGQSCYNCGYRLLIEVELDVADNIALKQLGRTPAKSPVKPEPLLSQSQKITSTSAAANDNSVQSKFRRHLAMSASLPTLDHGGNTSSSAAPAVRGGGATVDKANSLTAAEADAVIGRSKKSMRG